MAGLRASELFRQDTQRSGTLLDAADRETLIAPYLPSDPAAPPAKPRKTRPVRAFLRAQLHALVFAALHLLFSLYVRARQTQRALLRRVSAVLHYHHRTPALIRRDVRPLARLPQHLSVILTLPPEPPRRGGDGQPGPAARKLLEEVGELAAWCASAGIPTLSVYEETGALTASLPATHRAVAAMLHAYFGARRPGLQVRAPHQPSFLNGDGVGAREGETADDASDLGKRTGPLLRSSSLDVWLAHAHPWRDVQGTCRSSSCPPTTGARRSST